MNRNVVLSAAFAHVQPPAACGGSREIAPL